MYHEKLDYETLMRMTCRDIGKQYRSRFFHAVRNWGKIKQAIHPDSRISSDENLREIFGYYPDNFVLIEYKDITKTPKILAPIYHKEIIPRGKLEKKHIRSSLGRHNIHLDDLVKNYNKHHKHFPKMEYCSKNGKI